MKSFKLTLFLFTIWPFIVISSVDESDPLALEIQKIHKKTIVTENNLNENEHMINMTSDTIDHSQEFFYTQDLKTICHGQVNEFIWKCPKISDSEEKIFKFRTIHNQTGSTLFWYLKSVNDIPIVEMDPETYHQIEFQVMIDKQKISLNELYPTYPEISGFEILQFIANLAFQCKFSIDIFDVSDISPIYFALYRKSYYEYHFEGIKLTQNFLFEKIIVKKTIFLDCFKGKIKGLIENLSQLFYENIQLCENAFVSVEFCPIIFDTQYIFYKNSFEECIDWSPIGGFPQSTHPLSQNFEILSEDINRIMKRQKKRILFRKNKSKIE